MRVMTFNILLGGVDENGSRIEFIKKTINDASPDFVALQEANHFEKDNDKLLKEVSQHVGLKYYALSPGSRLDGKQYHVASFSRYPFKETHLFSARQFQCAGLFTVMGSPLGELAICNVQLNLEETGHSEDKRLGELEIIFKHVSGHKTQILLGDFNSLSLDDDYQLDTLEVEPRFDVTNRLKRNYVDVASYLKLDNRSTYPTATNQNPAYTKPLRIDYIFVTPSLVSNIKDASVIKTPTAERASDHYPIIATIE